MPALRLLLYLLLLCHIDQLCKRYLGIREQCARLIQQLRPVPKPLRQRFTTALIVSARLLVYLMTAGMICLLAISIIVRASILSALA